MQPASEARYRNPPPRFTSEQKKSDAASELQSSDEEKAQSNDEEDKDQCERGYQVLAQPTCKKSMVFAPDGTHRHSVYEQCTAVSQMYKHTHVRMSWLTPHWLTIYGLPQDCTQLALKT